MDANLENLQGQVLMSKKHEQLSKATANEKKESK